MSTFKKTKKVLKTVPFDIFIYIASTREKFLLKKVNAEMKIKELKCYAELVVGIPYNLQRLQYLDEGDMLDDSDLRHNDVVSGATINLKLWRMWETLVAAVCRGAIDQVLKEGVTIDKAWQSLDPVSYRNKVSLAKERASVALFIAAHRGHINLIRTLTEHSEADVNMKTPFGRTPLHAASSQGHSNAIDLMLEKGASMDEVDVQGKSALAVAGQWGFKDSERHLFLFQWQTRAAKTKHRKPSKTLLMHQQFDSAYPTWLKGQHAQVYFCQTLPPGEFAGTGISAPRRKKIQEIRQLQYDSFVDDSPDERHHLPHIDNGSRHSTGEYGRPSPPRIRSVDRLTSSKSQGSSKSATFDEWLEDKKLKRQKQEQKEKEDKWRQEMERRNKRLAKMGGLKSFEDWKNSKTSKQTRDLPNAEKRRDDVVREEPGRKYSIGFERWLNRAGALDLY